MNNEVIRPFSPSSHALKKTPTGIAGLDEITEGGLPAGRSTLICGGAGCGKTLFSVEFLARGILDYNEPGVIMAFEETAEDLAQNVASLGYDLDKMQADKMLLIDHVRLDKNDIEETGDFDLEGIFIRLGHAIDTLGAKRVVLDTLETLFAGITNTMILRSELRRLFRWLKDKGVTSIITAERGEGKLTRHGMEEYVSDCVILLDNRVINQVTTRRLRIVKYRGSIHGTNEYPFLIDNSGITVMPVTSLKLEHAVSSERVSTGIEKLDEMLSGKGYLKGSTVLALGSAGTGKTSISASFAKSVCESGKKCLYFAFEESPNQIMRNMKSIGCDLEPYVEKGCLQFFASRPTVYGLEMHLVMMHKAIEEFKPDVVIVDPMTNLIAVGDFVEVKTMLTRLIDFLKVNMVTALFTALVQTESFFAGTIEGISSLIDTLILVRNIEQNNEMHRGICVVKSRGMSHSNKIREFIIAEDGIDIQDFVPLVTNNNFINL
ncbi:MAG: circadian clock protein KaiC [Sphingobacteriales bacterium]|nr:MAG: circadian clock protein KaiC [Sphingobacteriales bacterium]